MKSYNIASSSQASLSSQPPADARMGEAVGVLFAIKDELTIEGKIKLLKCVAQSGCKEISHLSRAKEELYHQINKLPASADKNAFLAQCLLKDTVFGKIMHSKRGLTEVGMEKGFLSEIAQLLANQELSLCWNDPNLLKLVDKTQEYVHTIRHYYPVLYSKLKKFQESYLAKKHPFNASNLLIQQLAEHAQDWDLPLDKKPLRSVNFFKPKSTITHQEKATVSKNFMKGSLNNDDEQNAHITNDML